MPPYNEFKLSYDKNSVSVALMLVFETGLVHLSYYFDLIKLTILYKKWF